MAAGTGGLGRPGLWLLRGLGSLAGGGGGGIISGLDPQGTAQLMALSRGALIPLDFVGALNFLAGTRGVGSVAALGLLGATSGEVVGSVNELAGTSALELGEAMRTWALSGNY